MQEKYIVRLPIKDKDGLIIGYEVLYHGANQAFGASKENSSEFAAADAIYNYLMQNTDKLFRGSLNFMTFTTTLLMKKTPGDPDRVLNCYPYTTMANEKELFLRIFEVGGKGGSQWGNEQSYLTKLNPDFLSETAVADNWQEWVCDIPVTEDGVQLRATTDNTAYAITCFPYGTAGKLVFKTEGVLPENCQLLLSDCYLDRLNFMKNSRSNAYDESIGTLYHTLTPTETGIWEVAFEGGSITLTVNGNTVQTVPMTASAGLNHAAILFAGDGELRVTHFEASMTENRWETGIEY